LDGGGQYLTVIRDKWGEVIQREIQKQFYFFAYKKKRLDVRVKSTLQFDRFFFVKKCPYLIIIFSIFIFSPYFTQISLYSIIYIKKYLKYIHQIKNFKK
jgi:hypothetical protein